jgi:hypothetical protein
MRVVADGDTRVVEATAYRLRVVPGRPAAWLDDPEGRPWCELRLLASADTLEGVDETIALDGPEIEHAGDVVRLTWRLGSTHWDDKRLSLDCRDDELAVETSLRGRGRLTDVELLAGAAALPGAATGRFLSGARFATLFSPNPAHPGRIVTPATEPSTIGVSGGSEPGRGHWFFTPAPFCYAVTRTAIADPAVVPDGPWLSFGLAAPAPALGFTALDYVAADGGFGFRLAYEGHTAVDGDFDLPTLVIRPGAVDPYEALAGHRAALVTRGLARPPARTAKNTRPAWWLQPMFCGWGAQCHLARIAGEPLSAAPRYSTQQRYDAFLATLVANGVVPGTVVVDDKWQADYATGDPDPAKWPDMRGWIAGRHARGQRVLLWWKAWDPGSLPAELCVRTATGAPVAIDPDEAGARDAIRASVRRMLGADELDADGLKIDFTARTPSGVTLRHRGPGWGVELLRRLLETVHDEAKRLKPDSLLIGQAPNPAVDPYVDMIRLNDMLRLDDPEPAVPIVPQMRYRAAVVRAASPDHPVDTDDWCVPDLANWRAYAAIQPELGVPALYYATHLDLTGERLEPGDYALLRETWSAYCASHGLPPRGVER